MGNKNNERTSLRRRNTHLVKCAKLKQQKEEELASILDCTCEGQINKDFTLEINKDKMLEDLKSILDCTYQGKINKDFTHNVNKDKMLEELKILSL